MGWPVTESPTFPMIFPAAAAAGAAGIARASSSDTTTSVDMAARRKSVEFILDPSSGKCRGGGTVVGNANILRELYGRNSPFRKTVLLVERQALDRAIGRFTFAGTGELVHDAADDNDVSPRSGCRSGWKCAPEPRLRVPDLDVVERCELVHPERQSSGENDAAVRKYRGLGDETRCNEGAGWNELALAEPVDLARPRSGTVTAREQHVAGRKRDRDLLQPRDGHERPAGPRVTARVVDEGRVRRRAVHVDPAGHEDAAVDERDRTRLRAGTRQRRRFGPFVGPRVVD